MKNLNSIITKNKIIKALFAGLFLFAAFLTQAQCNANYTFTVSGANVLFTNTSPTTGSFTTYQWNFGDGTTANGLNASHTFSSNGYKNVCLTKTDSLPLCTSTKCDSVLITGASTVTTCNANFNFVLGANGLVNFNNTSTGTTTSTYYTWNFGGGSFGSGSNPSNTYTSNGPKLICLTMSDSIAGCNSTKCDSIIITSVGSSSVCAPSVVYFLSKDSTAALTWNAFPSYPAGAINATWYWGDGSTSVGLFPSHTYSAAGTYSTCVTVSVSCGTVTASYCYLATIFKSTQNNSMITLNVKSNPTSIKTTKIDNTSLNIYPNPSNGIVTIEVSNLKSLQSKVYVYNVLGKVVFEKEMVSNSNQIIDLSELNEGTYFVKLVSANGILNKKINIQK